MNWRPRLVQDWPLFVVALLFALVGGAAAGFTAAEWRLSPAFERLLTALSATSTPGIFEPVPADKQTVEIIPLERRPLASAYPPAFADRTESGVLILVRRAMATPSNDAVVSRERELGSAVALTSDGWLVATEASVANLKLADLAVIQNGSLTKIERAIRDRGTGLVYLKIESRGLPVATFVRSSNVLSGTAVWVESRPFQLRPESVIDTRLGAIAEPVPSEVAARRFLISGLEAENWSGAPVWDSGGRLIALLDEWDVRAQAWKATPVGSLSRDLGAILSSGEIRRASLGVTGLDLAELVFDARPPQLPSSGVWVRAVSAKGPAAKLLAEGDVIERIERDTLDGGADLGERLLDYRPGVSVTLSVIREGKSLEVGVTLGNIVTSEIIK